MLMFSKGTCTWRVPADCGMCNKGHSDIPKSHEDEGLGGRVRCLACVKVVRMSEWVAHGCEGTGRVPGILLECEDAILSQAGDASSQ